MAGDSGGKSRDASPLFNSTNADGSLSVDSRPNIILSGFRIGETQIALGLDGLVSVVFLGGVPISCLALSLTIFSASSTAPLYLLIMSAIESIDVFGLYCRWDV